MRSKFISLTCTVCLVFCFLFALTSCSSEQNKGIVNAQINGNGELILTYSDGTEQNLGIVVGKDGEKGTDGKDGIDGVNGKDGADGKNGKDGVSGAIGVTNDISIASSKGLCSAVRIICKFQATVQQGGWRPGSGNTTTKSYVSEGSGVIYSLSKDEGNAFIITNYHVVYDASSNTKNGVSDDISIYLYGSELEEKAITATYVGGSLYYDIAVLRVDDSEILKSSSACAVTLSDSDKVIVGDSAIAIGNAKGYGIAVSSGIVSVDSEYITMTAADGKTEVSFRVMRVDTAVNSGNSGGGLFDSQGNLIGIVNAKIIDDGVENIGYAIPGNIASSIADNIIYHCYQTDTERVQKATIGITVNAINSKSVYDSETGHITIHETVAVYEIAKDSLIDGVLQIGDVLLSVTLDGQKKEISRQFHVIDILIDMRAGDVVEFEIVRNGETQTVQITITENCLIAY